VDGKEKYLDKYYFTLALDGDVEGVNKFVEVFGEDLYREIAKRSEKIEKLMNGWTSEIYFVDGNSVLRIGFRDFGDKVFVERLRLDEAVIEWGHYYKREHAIVIGDSVYTPNDALSMKLMLWRLDQVLDGMDLDPSVKQAVRRAIRKAWNSINDGTLNDVLKEVKPRVKRFGEWLSYHVWSVIVDSGPEQAREFIYWLKSRYGELLKAYGIDIEEEIRNHVAGLVEYFKRNNGKYEEMLQFALSLAEKRSLLEALGIDVRKALEDMGVRQEDVAKILGLGARTTTLKV